MSSDSAASPLPFNIEAEKALIGALMIENRLAEEILLHLREEHFYEPLHGRIFSQIKKLLDQNMVVNPITLKPLFERDPAIADLFEAPPLAAALGRDRVHALNWSVLR